ncbi:MAG: T9SS type A sorting domain-containing protein [Saprospiraceae bacterium]|nr:T9SS type A sorting domain-containing protein [Saprospiraceae bacterium]
MKKTLTTVACLLLLFFCITAARSQSFPYAFSFGNTPYIPLSNATSITNGMIWDDPEEIIPIGFEFTLFGRDMTELDLSAGVGGTLSPPLNGEYPNPPVIVAYATDLIDRGYLEDVSQSEIVYLLEGTPGSRILKIEWVNAGFYNELFDNDTNNDFINLQLWLYEANNAIEIRFGPSSIADNEIVHSFLTGPLIGLVDTFPDLNPNLFGSLFFLTGQPASPEIAIVDDIDEIDFLTPLIGNPEDGQIYRFTPLTSSAPIIAQTPDVWKVFPTVAQNQITLEQEGAANEQLWNARIVDGAGRPVSTLTAIAGQYTEFDISRLPAGVYYLQVLNGRSIDVTKKFVKP